MKNFLAIIIIFVLSFTGCNKEKDIKDLPNVVLIVIDTLRADHLPFYGYKENTTPFLSKIAKKSVIFEKAFSTSSWTAPATASIFTSLYPFQHRVISNMLATLQFNESVKEKFKIKLNRIPKEIETLGEIFKKKGYSTFAVTDNTNIGKKEGFDQGFDKMETYSYKTAEIVNQTVKKWKDEILSKDKYFLYLHYMDVHQPNHKRERWFKNHSLKDNGGLPINKVPAEIKKFNQELFYDSELNYVDEKIEELFKLFKWNKNTLVIITADHGEEFWEHNLWGHGYSLFKEVIHVPLLFYYPDVKIKAKRIKQNVSIIDILPTLRDIIKLPKDRYNEGISLKEMLYKDKKKPINRKLYNHLVKRRITKEGIKYIDAYGTIYNKWHFIKELPGKKGKFTYYLFDWEKDFNETINLFDENIKTGKKLKNFYMKFFKTCEKFKSDIVDYKTNKKEMERLKTLGYVE